MKVGSILTSAILERIDVQPTSILSGWNSHYPHWHDESSMVEVSRHSPPSMDVHATDCLLLLEWEFVVYLQGKNPILLRHDNLWVASSGDIPLLSCGNAGKDKWQTLFPIPPFMAYAPRSLDKWNGLVIVFLLYYVVLWEDSLRLMIGDWMIP